MALPYHFRPSEGVINKARYRDAGVDIDAGAALVEAIKPLAASTARTGMVDGLGGFGALFDLKAAGFKDPVLVSGTDGVGTKLLVAIAADKHDTVGIDLVAMCVNDIVVQGAEPLFFLDYFATGKLDVGRARDVVAGIAEGCRTAGCALIGGETAELPGMYRGEDYDLAGFAVGAVERDRILTGDAIRAGDIVLGLASSGLHSNGFSLVRHIVERLGLDYAGPAPFADGTLAEALLAPTRIYVKSCLAAHRAGHVNGFAHVTGGGLVENVARVLPEGLAVEIRAETWKLQPVFDWLRRDGNVADEEMLRTFNCGIGMVVICGADSASEAERVLKDAGETVHRIGEVVTHAAGPLVSVAGTEAAWRG